MKVNTSRFGELDVDESQLFTFPMGILGFATLKSYLIIELEAQHPLKWLQSVEDPSTAFILADPLLFYPGYCAEIKRSELNPIDPSDDSDLILSVMMTVPPEMRELSANLCAPLIFNLANRRGMQYVLNDRKYPIKHFLFKEDTVSPFPFTDGAQGDSRSLSLR